LVPAAAERKPMISVFLVEDEFVVREGIKKNVDWSGNELQFAGEAADGELAYPMIQRLKPDIVITDIKMPFMGGLELAGLIRKELPETKIIILSGYGEFDFAKQAIGIGVTDYLLKPISSDKLLEAVNRIADEIRREREKKENLLKFEAEMKENTDIRRNSYFEEMISGQLSSADIISRGKENGVNLAYECFRVILYQVTGEEQHNEQESYSEKAVEFSEKIELQIKNLQGTDFFPRGAEGIAFLVKSDSDEELKERTEELLNLLITVRKSTGGLDYFAAIGRTVHRPKEISDSFASARKVFAYRYLGQKNRMIKYDETENFKVVDDSILDLSCIDAGKIDRDSVKNFLKNGLLSETPLFVEDYFTQLGNENMESLMFRQYVVLDIYFCAMSFLREAGFTEEEAKEKIGEMKDLSAVITSVRMTKDRLEKMILDTVEIRDQKVTKKYGKLIDDAKEYIRQNYESEDISLNAAAESVNLSPNHFSTIFSQETGHTFIEYLTDMRMEKARELLRCTDLKSSEIAYRIGYRDPHYFSYLFKKINNCSPREYREKK
jgi:two-component system response regulator YesN